MGAPYNTKNRAKLLFFLHMYKFILYDLSVSPLTLSSAGLRYVLSEWCVTKKPAGRAVTMSAQAQLSYTARQDIAI